MISKAQVIERMHSGGKLEITTRFDTVELFGVAVCDTVYGSEGREKLRAKFGHGIKAVLELRDYGKLWDAEEAPQEETEAAEEAAEDTAEMLEAIGETQAEAAEAGDGLPWYGDTPEEQEQQRQEAERLRRESKRAYDRERYRRRKAAQTPEAAEIERNNKRQYDAARYLARKQRAAAAPPPLPEAAARIGAEG